MVVIRFTPGSGAPPSEIIGKLEIKKCVEPFYMTFSSVPLRVICGDYRQEDDCGFYAIGKPTNHVFIAKFKLRLGEHYNVVNVPGGKWYCVMTPYCLVPASGSNDIVKTQTQFPSGTPATTFRAHPPSNEFFVCSKSGSFILASPGVDPKTLPGHWFICPSLYLSPTPYDRPMIKIITPDLVDAFATNPRINHVWLLGYLRLKTSDSNRVFRWMLDLAKITREKSKFQGKDPSYHAAVLIRALRIEDMLASSKKSDIFMHILTELCSRTHEHGWGPYWFHRVIPLPRYYNAKFRYVDDKTQQIQYVKITFICPSYSGRSVRVWVNELTTGDLVQSAFTVVKKVSQYSIPLSAKKLAGRGGRGCTQPENRSVVWKQADEQTDLAAKLELYTVHSLDEVMRKFWRFNDCLWALLDPNMEAMLIPNEIDCPREWWLEMLDEVRFGENGDRIPVHAQLLAVDCLFRGVKAPHASQATPDLRHIGWLIPVCACVDTFHLVVRTRVIERICESKNGIWIVQMWKTYRNERSYDKIEPFFFRRYVTSGLCHVTHLTESDKRSHIVELIYMVEKLEMKSLINSGIRAFIAPHIHAAMNKRCEKISIVSAEVERSQLYELNTKAGLTPMQRVVDAMMTRGKQADEIDDFIWWWLDLNTNGN
jgi:hypothetical protein